MELRKKALRAWMFERDITYQAVAAQIGVSLATAGRLLNADEIPRLRYEQLLGLGFPVEILPEPLDRKRGPKPKEPRFPAIQEQ